MSLFDELTTLDDVQSLIADGVREGETIDYKHLKNWEKGESDASVAKDASAFANSAGGLLVYGVATSKDDPTMPDRIVGLEPQLIRKVQRAITDLIRHPIPGVRWKSLPAGAAPEVFLVDIPASPLAPHQHARERVYYRREGDQNLAMSHDLVEMYFGRRLGPVLVAKLEMIAQPERHAGYGEWSQELAIRLENAGAGSAREIMLVISQPRDNPQIGIDRVGRERGMDVLPWSEGEDLIWRASTPDLIVHPTERVRAVVLRIRIPQWAGHGALEFCRLSLYADRMAPSHWSLLAKSPFAGVVSAFEARRIEPGDSAPPHADD